MNFASAFSLARSLPFSLFPKYRPQLACWASGSFVAARSECLFRLGLNKGVKCPFRCPKNKISIAVWAVKCTHFQCNAFSFISDFSFFHVVFWFELQSISIQDSTDLQLNPSIKLNIVSTMFFLHIIDSWPNNWIAGPWSRRPMVDKRSLQAPCADNLQWLNCRHETSAWGIEAKRIVGAIPNACCQFANLPRRGER